MSDLTVAQAPIRPNSAGTVLVDRRPKRIGELVLILAAVGIGVSAYICVGLGVTGEVPANALAYALGFLGLFLVAHVAVRLLAPWADSVLLPAAAMLNMLGLAIIHRLDLAEAASAVQAGDPLPKADAATQLIWTGVGVALFVMVLAFLRDHRTLQRYTYTAMILGLAFLLMPLLPHIGTTVNGARLWLRFGHLTFQPAEIAKILLIIFFAGYLVSRRDVLASARTRILGIDFPRGRDMGPLLLVWLTCLAVLIFERDLGTAMLFFGLFVALLYVATSRKIWLVVGGIMFVIGAVLATRAFAHVQERVDVWLHPWATAQTTGYQMVQALFGLSTGGTLGTGLGQGHPDFVPFAKTDFIVAAAGEELGLTGLFALLVLYAIIVERGLRIAVAVRDSFGSLLAAGLAIVIGLQVFIVVGGVTRLIPLTGLTTPFMSYGGSSLVTNWILIALLLRISDASRRPAPAPEIATDDALTQVVYL